MEDTPSFSLVLGIEIKTARRRAVHGSQPQLTKRRYLRTFLNAK
jgi:hypothetical protein